MERAPAGASRPCDGESSEPYEAEEETRRDAVALSLPRWWGRQARKVGERSGDKEMGEEGDDDESLPLRRWSESYAIPFQHGLFSLSSRNCLSAKPV